MERSLLDKVRVLFVRCDCLQLVLNVKYLTAERSETSEQSFVSRFFSQIKSSEIVLGSRERSEYGHKNCPSSNLPRLIKIFFPSVLRQL